MLNEQARSIYYWEIRERAEYAQRAWREAQSALSRRNTDDFWYSMNAFLNSAIAVCNVAWPSKRASSAAKARAAGLRAALGVSTDAPAGLREVRNGFEHFDERIDRWYASSTNHAFIDTNIGPKGSISVPGVSDKDVARHFDPSTAELGVFGDYMVVETVVEELAALVAKLPPRY